VRPSLNSALPSLDPRRGMLRGSPRRCRGSLSWPRRRPTSCSAASDDRSAGPGALGRHSDPCAVAARQTRRRAPARLPSERSRLRAITLSNECVARVACAASNSALPSFAASPAASTNRAPSSSKSCEAEKRSRLRSESGISRPAVPTAWSLGELPGAHRHECRRQAGQAGNKVPRCFRLGHRDDQAVQTREEHGTQAGLFYEEGEEAQSALRALPCGRADPIEAL
jgi:hypothetical protein